MTEQPDDRPRSTPADAVDLSPLEEIIGLPVSEHLSRYERVHASLRDALADVER